MSGREEPEIPGAPDAQLVDRLVDALAPLRRITSPKVYGIDNVPRSGALLVGNHTLFGFLDLPFMLAELWDARQIAVRSLGDHAHYGIPVWRDLLESCGMVRGTRANAAELMRRGENVLVFPGGSREVNKRRGEKYQLIWKGRLGFARLAVEHGYPIVPFASVGAEEMLDIVIDDNNPVYAQVTNAVTKLTGWPLQPLVRGIGPTPLPRPERLYFWFGEPVKTTEASGATDAELAARRVRDKVRRQVEAGIAFLLAERESDPDRGLAARLLGRSG